jgi:hypothetical protein
MLDNTENYDAEITRLKHRLGVVGFLVTSWTALSGVLGIDLVGSVATAIIVLVSVLFLIVYLIVTVYKIKLLEAKAVRKSR